MRKKRILSMIVALAAVVFGAGIPGGAGKMPDLSPAVSAEGVNGLGVSGDRVRRGDTFEVSMNIPAVSKVADTVEFRIYFDPSAFEVTYWRPTVSSGTMLYNCDNNEGFVAFVAANASVDLSRGLKIAATVKVKDTAALGSHTFELKRVGVCNTDTGYNWIPSVISSTVRVIDMAVTVSGGISLIAPDNFSDSAVVTMTDSSGNSQSTTVRLTKRNGKYVGSYAFNNAESGESYTIQIAVPGCTTRTETITAGQTSLASDLPVNIIGDVDGNGQISAVDATHILKYVVGLPCAIKDKNGIVDRYILSVACVEGRTTLSERDATQILRYLAGFSSVFDNL